MEKYKLIIVDDEEIIRETLASYVDWEGLGFEIVLVAEDGQQVINFLEKDHADVVLTDIQMCNTNGLRVADYAHRKGNVKTVLLSGYQEFEFAKKAIQYQVKEYLLKPISISTMEECFRKIRQELDREQQEQRTRERMEEDFTNLKLITLEKLFELTTVGMLENKTEISDYLDKYCLREMAEDNYYCEARLEIANGENEDTDYNILINDIIMNIVEMIAKKYQFYHIFVICSEDENMFRIIGSRRKPIEKDLWREEIEDSIQKICNFSVSVQVILDWRPFWSYMEAFSKLYSPRQVLVHMEKEDTFFITISRQFLLIMNMTDDLKEVSNKMAEGLFESIRNLKMTDQIQYVIKIVKLMEELVNSRCEYKKTKLLLDFDMRHETLEDYFKRCIETLYEQLHKSSMQQSVITQIRKMVIQRITETVTLKEAAEAVFFSPNYFSHVFKEQSGENFSDFCIRLKMEKAAELLENSRYKVYEISDYLGYKNIKYFYKLFKRVYHCTPTEYREAEFHDKKKMESMEVY